MTDEQKRQILREVLEFSGGRVYRDRQPGDFTIAEAAEEWDVTTCTARQRLEKAVKAGLLETAWTKSDGRPCRLFWKVA